MFAITYDFHEPGFPPKDDAGAPADLTHAPRPLAEVLAERHSRDAVMSPLAWPEGGAGFRTRKPWMLDSRSEFTPYRLVMLDYDTTGHVPWKSTEEAEAAVERLHAAVLSTFGAAFTYASRRGVRAVFLTPAPVPLFFADSWLRHALDAAPAVPGLQPPDRLTWTTGQRPPWFESRIRPPWKDDYPPFVASESLVATWEPGAPLADERAKLAPSKALPMFDARALTEAEAVAFVTEMDVEVLDMVETIRTSTARHPTMFACARRVGGWIARLHLPEGVASALEVRYADLLTAAAPDSNDASRTVRDGIIAGRAAPVGLPSVIVDFFERRTQ